MVSHRIVVGAFALLMAGITGCSGSSSSSSSGTSGTPTATGTSGASSGTSGITSGSSGSSATTGLTSGSSGSGGFETAHARCLQIASTSCQHNVSCGYIASADVGLCEATWNCDSTTVESVNDEQVTAGLATVNQTELAACLSAINAAPCNEGGGDVERVTPACDEIARGQTADGDSCTNGADCLPSSTCVRSTTACGGTCQAWITSGPCGPGYPGVADNYSCGDDGGVMAQFPQGTTCVADKDCQGELLCAGVVGARTCQPLGALTEGASCTGANTCGASLACFGARVDGGGTCLTRSPVGGSCKWIFPDGGLDAFNDGGARPQSGLCEQETYCDPATITCLGEALLGTGCATDGGDPACLEGACVVQGDGSGLCAYLADGTPCTGSGDCTSGYCFPVGDGGDVCGSTCP